MSIIKQNNKILRSASGELVDDIGGNSSKLLHIDFDLQQRNRVFKDGSNLLKQVTDKLKNIPFFSESGEEPQFIYGSDGIHYVEFNGVDDLIYSEQNVNTNQDITIEFCLKFNSTGTNQIILSGDSKTTYIWELYLDAAKTLRLIRNGLGAAGWDLSAFDLTTDFHHYAIVLDGSNAYLFIDGIYVSSSLFSGYLSNAGILNIGRLYRVGSAPLDGQIKSIQIYSAVKYSNGASGNFSPKQPYFYYKRFKPDSNILCYLNSRYLKDCDINTSDQINRIEDEQNNIGFSQSIGNAKLTNKGILLESSQATQLNSDFIDISQIGTGDFTLMASINALNTSINSTGVWIQNILKLFSNGVNWRFQILAGALLSLDIEPITNGYCSLFAIRKNGVVYVGYNGILKNSGTNTYDFGLIGTDQRLLIGAANINGTLWGYYDEIYFSKNAIVDPTGKSIGQKVFEPLRRRSLNNEIIEY